MEDVKVKQPDGSETLFSEETFEEAKDILAKMTTLASKMKDNLASRQLIDCVMFCKVKGVRADELVLLAVNGMHENLVRASKHMAEVEKKAEQKQEEQDADIPKDLN